MAVTFRRRRGSDTWHFCSNCSEWPRADYDERATTPGTGLFCDECIRKRAGGACV
jgi:hypothetical protein